MVYLLRNAITKDLKPQKMAKIGAMFGENITNRQKDSAALKALNLYVEGNLPKAKPELEDVKKAHAITLAGWARFGAENLNTAQKADVLEWSAQLSFTDSILLDIGEAPNNMQIYENLKFSIRCYGAISCLKGIEKEWKETAIKKGKTIFSITQEFALGANFEINRLLLGKQVDYADFIKNILQPPKN